MKRQGGFTILEVLIGAFIGIIGMFMILRTQEDFDRNKRALSSGGEAQVSGTVAAFQLERDIRNGGMGITGEPIAGTTYFGCSVAASDNGTAFTFPLAPVRIIDGAGGAPDQIHVLYGSSQAPSSTYIVQSSGADSTLLDSRGGVEVGDLAVLASASGCRLLHISAVTAAPTPVGTGTAAPQIDHMTGSGLRYAGSTAISLTFPASNAVLHNLGKAPTGTDWQFSPRLNAWAIDGNRLVRANLLNDHASPPAWGDVVDNVVDLQAEYGLDTDGDTAADTWTATTPANAAAWEQLRLIRFAILIRGQERANAPVTTTAPVWAGGAFTMRNVDGTADSGAGGAAINNWRHYKYQVQEVMVPLRNMIWRNVAA